MRTQLNQILRSPVVQRLGRGFAAQGYGHVVGIGLQLASVPILLSVWGEARYGSWLLLSALTTYLTLSDLGFSQAATNDMTVSMSTGRTDQARRTFHSLLALCVGVGGIIILIGGALTGLFHMTDLLNLSGVSEVEAKAVTLLLSVQVALSILNGGLAGALRAQGRFATMASINNTVRLGEGLACIGAAIAGWGVIGAAATILLVRCISVVLFFGMLSNTASNLRPGMYEARFHDLRRLIGPSLSYMAFPLGNALMIQGTLTLVGLRLPAAVVLFATSRTLTRIGATVLGSINHVFLFDYGRTLGNDDRPAFFRLLRLNGMIIFVGIIIYTLAMVSFGPIFYRHWTGKSLEVDTSLLTALVVLAAAESIWAYFQTPLIAVNAHAVVTITYVFGAILSLSIGTIFLGRGMTLDMFVWVQATIYAALAVVIVVDLRRRLTTTHSMARPGSAL